MSFFKMRLIGSLAKYARNGGRCKLLAVVPPPNPLTELLALSLAFSFLLLLLWFLHLFLVHVPPFQIGGLGYLSQIIQPPRLK